MDQTDRNALDYESCRRIWRRVSPELNPYPEEKEATDCPAAPAPDLKGLQEMIADRKKLAQIQKIQVKFGE